MSTSIKIFPIFIVIFTALALGACVNKDDFVALQNQVHSNQQASNQRFKAMDAKLSATRSDMAQEIKNAGSPLQSRQANMWSEMEAMRRSQGMLEGKIDAFSRQVQALETTQTNSTQVLDDILLELSAIRMALTGQVGVDLPPSRFAPVSRPLESGVNATMTQVDMIAREDMGRTNATSSAALEQATTHVVSHQDPGKLLYAKARQEFELTNYDKARRMWGEFAQVYPEDALVSNAIFWQGECYYQMKDYPKAILAYQQVIEKYKKSPKYPTSLLKQGISFYKLKKNKAGRIILEDLVKRYPKSPEAKRAKAILNK